MEIKKSPKVANKFKCEKCHYACCKESDFIKHLYTRKHEKEQNGNNISILEIEKIAKPFKCINCSKEYKTNSGLWKHSKICNINHLDNAEDNIDITTSNNDFVKVFIKENTDFKNIILELVKSNCDIQKQMTETYKTSSTVNNNNTNINSHNKTFNLQFFLNEQCKDAMNLTDFINSIRLKLSDLENIGKLGYTEGISQIIINQLNDTDMYKRPMHCSDVKREVLYIKDEDKWGKEDSSNTKIKKAVKDVEKKNINLLSTWTDSHPNFKVSTSHENDTYLKLIVASTDGDDENVNNVIKKISKNIVIEKEK